MKIAFVCPVVRKISAKNKYGGIERIITSLALAAANSGHQVTLYAPFGSDLKHSNLKIRFTTDKDISGIADLTKKAEADLFQRIIVEQPEFDIIHSHIEPFIARTATENYFSSITKPFVVTFHNLTYIDSHINYYKSHHEIHNLNYVFISKDQAKPLDFLPNQTVIYNGIDLKDLTFNAKPNPNQLAFLGRITPEKGIAEAIKIAKLANKKLIIGAAIDPTKLDFYEKEIKPQIDGDKIIYLGEVNNEQKNQLLRTSEALLFPIKWHEPFGLVLVEAMATGTPIVASDFGSVPEIIEDNKTGFIIHRQNNINDYIDKLNQIKQIDRKLCHTTAKERFSVDIMTQKYLDYYELLLRNSISS